MININSPEQYLILLENCSEQLIVPMTRVFFSFFGAMMSIISDLISNAISSAFSFLLGVIKVRLIWCCSELKRCVCGRWCSSKVAPTTYETKLGAKIELSHRPGLFDSAINAFLILSSALTVCAFAYNDYDF